jgi:hypothetical protein
MYFQSMDLALETLSKEQLITLLRKEQSAIKNHQKINFSLQEENAYLKHRVELLERLQFGQKRERFEGDPAQGVLPFEVPVEEEAQQEEEVKEQITYTRQKQSAHKGRAALPAHLPVEEIEIHPEGDLSEMVCIGKEVTEELECEPARFFIRRYIRYKYAAKNGEGIKTGELPERIIDKGIPGAGLLSMILTDKYMDHLPLYRQKPSKAG